MNRLMRSVDNFVEISDSHLSINNDQRSNAHYGKQIVCEMQVLVDRRASVEELEKHFAKFQPWDTESTQERQVLLRGQEVIIKAMRFRGDLEKAEQRYVDLMSRYPRDSRPARFMASFAELLCDSDQSKRALEILDVESKFRDKATGRRLEMAVTQAYLTAALWDFKRKEFGDESRNSLALAATRFKATITSLEGEGLQRLYQTNRGHYFVACAGLAIIEHVAALLLIQEGADSDCTSLKDQLKVALLAWDTAHKAHEAARALV